MDPWTGIDYWISWRGTLWDLGPAALFVNTGTRFGWWLAWEDTMGRRLKVSGG